MNYYQAKSGVIAGSNYKEVYKYVSKIYSDLRRKSKRQSYIRSAYFNKQKVFLNLFWIHLFDKSNNVRTQRLKLIACGIELIRKSRIHPESKDNPNDVSEIVHRFSGITKSKVKFAVQIKEIKRTNKKYLISIFPYD